jgi:serine/threonine-protein kinase RsbW
VGAEYRRVVQASIVASSRLREEFRRWLAGLGWPEDETDDLVIALNEAASMLVKRPHSHGGPNGGCYVAVRAVHAAHPSGRRVIIELSEWASWQPSGDALRVRGRGLRLVRARTAQVAVQPTSFGIRLRLVSWPVAVPASCDVPGLPSPRQASDDQAVRCGQGRSGQLDVICTYDKQ